MPIMGRLCYRNRIRNHNFDVSANGGDSDSSAVIANRSSSKYEGLCKKVNAYVFIKCWPIFSEMVNLIAS